MVKHNSSTTAAFFLVYTVAVFLYYYFLAAPYLDGITECQAAADALTYIGLARDFVFDDYLSFGANLFGPVLMVRLLDTNFLMVIFNYSLLLLSCDLLRRLRPGMSSFSFAVLLLNPMIFISTGAVNKEIPAIFVTVLTVFSFSRKYYSLLFISLVISVLVRWQQLVVSLLFIFFILAEKFLPFRRLTILAILVFFLSLAFPLLLAETVSEAVSIENIVEGSSLNRSTVAMVTFNAWQDSFLYFIALPFKVVINIFGGIGKIYFLDFDSCNIYQSFAVLGSSISFLLVLILLVVNRRKIDISDDFLLFTLLYIVIFSLSPFVSHRYYLPIFPLLCTLIALAPKHKSTRLDFQGS